MRTSLLALALLAASLAAQEDAAPRWYKGNLHTHSLWSDGNDLPDSIAAWYKDHGYHFLALSDHNVLSRGKRWMDLADVEKRGGKEALARCRARFGEDWVEVRTRDGKEQVRLKPLDEFRPKLEEAGKFLLIEGEEITDRFGKLPVHMNATNLAEPVAPQGGESVQDVMRRIIDVVMAQRKKTGRAILIHLNHPNFGWGVTAEDLAAVVEERFYEVYNGHPGVNHRGDATRPSVERIWDVANTIRLEDLKAPPLFGLGTDDSHNYFSAEGSTPGRGWVMVRTSELSPDAIVAAIEAGDFYASSGVELSDVRFDAAGQTLAVEVAVREGVEYAIEFIGTNEGGDAGQVLSRIEGARATYTLTGKELYVRAVVTASVAPENPSFEGQRAQAWTQPVGWDARVGR